MKRHGKILMLLLAMALIAAPATKVQAATPEQIEQAIVDGLAWLADQQNEDDGSWGGGCDRVAKTGLAVLKLESRAIELGLDPMGEEYEYSQEVSDGLAYILANSYNQAIGMEPAGDPDGNGNGIGVYFTDCGYDVIYNSGIAMMAIASSGHPEMFGDILQDAVDFMAWAQADTDCGWNRGGWRYGADQCASDNSNSGYATLGLGFAAAAPPFGFGLTVPQFVKDELNLWLGNIQDPVNGDADDGGSYYDSGQNWVNVLKTGNLIYEFGLVGDDAGSLRVQDALDYLERHWGDAADPGWRPDHYQAMFTIMKGLEALGIDTFGAPEIDWYSDLADAIVTQQNDDGSWSGCPCFCWANPPNPPGSCYYGCEPVICTAWALLTLEKAVPPVEIPVFVDIKPQSCPNPINLKSKGVLPVAVLGTAEFNVTDINPWSIRLSRDGVEDEEGDPILVAPLRRAYEDVATPFEGELCDCHEFGADGYVDMTLKFDAEEVVEELELADVAGETVRLTLTGYLWGENLIEPGPRIRGEDCVWVLKEKGPQKKTR